MSDELRWNSREENHYRADSHVSAASYVVYIGTWDTPNHLVAVYVEDDDIDDVHRRTLYRSVSRDFDAAKAAAQAHHDAACRARRWMDFMRDNEPPEQP